MEKEFKVICPDCGVILLVDRLTGEVMETRKPIIEQSTGDRFADAIIKVKKDREKLASTKFDDLKKMEEKKKKLAEDIFRTSMERTKNDKDLKY